MKSSLSEQDFSADLLQRRSKQIAIIGAGASGCVCAYFLLKSGFEVTLFDKGSPLRTLLPTGGGRCNLAHAEYDFKELAKNYPRGEKFLYSVFSKFSTYDTLALFKELGIETYTQENNRIFPTSNSAKQVRDIILNNICRAKIIKEGVNEICPLDKGFKVKTNKAEYFFTDVIVSVGGHSDLGFLKNFNLNIIEQKPSLVGLNTNIKAPSGIVIKGVECEGIVDDILFTHFGISGPLAYKISSIKAKENYPYKLTLNFFPRDFDLQEILNSNPHKEMKTILTHFFHLPLNFSKFLLGHLAEVKAHKIDGKVRDKIGDKIHNFEINILGVNKGEETVTAGGIDLKEVNSKTIESKKYPHLYFTGEVLDIDGFCGGFNLQNAWSTAFVVSEAIKL